MMGFIGVPALLWLISSAQANGGGLKGEAVRPPEQSGGRMLACRERAGIGRRSYL
jgi:hypothetical protein